MNDFWEINDPDFTNEDGVKWWIDKNTTQYSKSKNYIVYVVKDKDYVTRVIVDNSKNQIVYESQKLEAIGAFLDILNFMDKNPIR